MITLLNGDTYSKEEIISMAYDDEFYYGVLGKNALSSSALKMLLKSPKTYRNVLNYGSTESAALVLGKLLHWMVLEPHKIKKTKSYRSNYQKHKSIQRCKDRTSRSVFKKRDKRSRKISRCTIKKRSCT